MTDIPITTIFVSCYAIALLVMGGWIGILRGNINALRGHGGNPVLEKRIRIHGNLSENAPAMALMLAASELLLVADWVLWLAISSFIAGRIGHFILFDRKTRGVPMFLTQAPAAFLGIWCLHKIIGGQ